MFLSKHESDVVYGHNIPYCEKVMETFSGKNFVAQPRKLVQVKDVCVGTSVLTLSGSGTLLFVYAHNNVTNETLCVARDESFREQKIISLQGDVLVSVTECLAEIMFVRDWEIGEKRYAVIDHYNGNIHCVVHLLSKEQLYVYPSEKLDIQFAFVENNQFEHGFLVKGFSKHGEGYVYDVCPHNYVLRYLDGFPTHFHVQEILCYRFKADECLTIDEQLRIHGFRRAEIGERSWDYPALNHDCVYKDGKCVEWVSVVPLSFNR